MSCKPNLGDFIHYLDYSLPDGFPCSRDSICINSECRKFGCDLKIESNAIVDNCGICNGNNSKCKLINSSIAFISSDYEGKIFYYFGAVKFIAIHSNSKNLFKFKL